MSIEEQVEEFDNEFYMVFERPEFLESAKEHIARALQERDRIAREECLKIVDKWTEENQLPHISRGALTNKE